MKLKRILTLTAAAALTTALLTGCPWEQDDAASSEPSSSSSRPSRPSHDSDSGDDDTETPDEPNEPEEPDEPDNPIVDGKLTITGGSGDLTEAAFEGVDKTEIIELDLSDSGYTSIGNYVFAGCTRLESINLPNSLTSIGEAAFEGCTSLQSIDLPDSLTTIKMNAFEGCSSLQSIDLPDNLTTIGGGAFAYCIDLTSVTLPDGLTSIENNAFMRTGLTEIKLPDTLTSIGSDAFYDCTSLTKIYVGEGILSATIDEGAFDSVGGSTTVTIYYPSDWGEEELNALKNKLATYLSNSEYKADTKPTQTTSELPNGVKELMEAARLFEL